MRRLSLILSDLYLPEQNGGGEIPRTHELPALEWLLRFANRPQRILDWRQWLLSHAGDHVAGQRIATIAGGSQLIGKSSESALLATPVHLEARLDHVRLVDRGLLHTEPAERAAWCAEFAGVFGPQYSLHECGERAFLLTGVPATSVRTVDPARLLGAEIGPALPGAQATELRRLWTEIEMWLHGSPLNVARERAGKQRIGALWLWGNEPCPRREVAGPKDLRCYGADPLMRSLANPGGPGQQVTALSQADDACDHLIVEFAPMSGKPHEALPALEANWFAPARAALAQRALQFIEVVANDRVFRVMPHAGWRLWRRRRGWLESLA
jgi:hypothetical protein